MVLEVIQLTFCKCIAPISIVVNLLSTRICYFPWLSFCHDVQDPSMLQVFCIAYDVSFDIEFFLTLFKAATIFV